MDSDSGKGVSYLSNSSGAHEEERSNGAVRGL